MILESEKVKMFLPHRYPFLFIDSVSEVTWKIDCQKVFGGSTIQSKDLLGAQVEANYRTKKEHVIFEGHFPGHPILPGVVQVEMMAQASSFVLLKCFENPFAAQLDVALVSISDAKFRKPIFPEMDLVLKTVCTKARGAMLENQCEIYFEGQLMSEAKIMAAIKY